MDMNRKFRWDQSVDDGQMMAENLLRLVPVVSQCATYRAHRVRIPVSSDRL